MVRILSLLLGICVAVSASSQSDSGIRFGAFVDGEFREAQRIPNTAGHSYGWIATIKPTGDRLRWTERFTLPEAPETWGQGDGNVEISADRRTATTVGYAAPRSNVVFHFWQVAAGDPDGRYSMLVTLSDGRAAEFHFELTSDFSTTIAHMLH